MIYFDSILRLTNILKANLVLHKHCELCSSIPNLKAQLMRNLHMIDFISKLPGLVFVSC